MQPYYLPYLAYWQLVNSCDTFVLLDDTYHRTRGWINRNRILVQNSVRWMTLPLAGGSQNRRIHQIELSDHRDWKSRTLSTVKRAYSKSPYLDNGVEFLETLLEFPDSNLASFLEYSVRMTSARLGIETQIRSVAREYDPSQLTGLERIVEICEVEEAAVYINPVRGAFLYEPAPFRERDIEVRFLQADWGRINLKSECPEGPFLSILDLIMWNTPDEIFEFLGSYDLLCHADLSDETMAAI